MKPQEGVEVYFGLGANLGDPVQQILDACGCLNQRVKGQSAQLSRFYISSPVGYSEQPNFINAVLRLVTRSDCMQVLNMVHSIEQSLGRHRDPSNQNAPRTIDIDILLFGQQSVLEPRLQLPHPRMFERRFVLMPLLDVLPIDHPERARCQRSLAELASDSDQTVDVLEC